MYKFCGGMTAEMGDFYEKPQYGSKGMSETVNVSTNKTVFSQNATSGLVANELTTDAWSCARRSTHSIARMAMLDRLVCSDLSADIHVHTFNA